MSNQAWIDVRESAPETEHVVWCYGTYGYRDEPCSFEGFYDRGGIWRACNNGDYVDGGYGQDYDATVTHWMPLPEPPNA